AANIASRSSRPAESTRTATTGRLSDWARIAGISKLGEAVRTPRSDEVNAVTAASSNSPEPLPSRSCDESIFSVDAIDETSSPIVANGYRLASETPARIASSAAGPGPEPFSLLPIRTSPVWPIAAAGDAGAMVAARFGPHAPAPAATALPPTSLRKSRRDDTV